MQKNYYNHLSTLFSCLQEMKHNCQEHHWELLSKNEETREKLVEEIKRLKPDNTTKSIQLIEQLIQLNKEVIAVANENKDESEKSLLEIKRNIKKTSQYQ